MVVDRWRWIFRFRSLPKVWIAKKIPGRHPFIAIRAGKAVVSKKSRPTHKKFKNIGDNTNPD